jgi:isopentenyl-diphosphate Delta-isomerase
LSKKNGLQEQEGFKDHDKSHASRKQDHITLAFESQVRPMELDQRFHYEPVLSSHPKEEGHPKIHFLGRDFRVPFWVSSMTGGTKWARTINHNLARAAQEFGFGMGLGSCRRLLTDDTYLEDFNVRPLIGEDLPLYANLGIAQIERLIEGNKLFLMDTLLQKLKVDGLVVHINPLQEWLQPEGDRFFDPPLVTLERLIDQRPNLKIIVKEVGQGMGYQSLKALLQLPLECIEFGAAGGTNFALVELLRANEELLRAYQPLTTVGHTAEEMVDLTNGLLKELGSLVLCHQIIISGGIQSFLHGYYLMNKVKTHAIYGQASSFLAHARGSYEELRQHVQQQVEGLRMAEAFLVIKENLNPGQ